MLSIDVLNELIHWIDRELHGMDEATDVWDAYLHIVLKDYISRHEPSPDKWADMKAKLQREAVLNQVHSCVP